MKILIVTPLIPPEPGGPSYYSVALKDALIRAGHRADLLAFRGVRKYPSGIRHLLFFYQILWRARNVDALVILDTVSVALPAVVAGWLLAKPTLIRAGGDFVWEHYIERTKEKVLLSEFYTKHRKLSLKERLLVFVQKEIIFKLVTKTVFNTAWQRDIWEKPYNLQLENIGVVENSYPSKTSVAEGGDAFLCVWRPTTFKNVDTLEKAFEIAEESCPGVQLEKLSNIPREELHERMKQARALVIPSLSELGPNMAMEALALGVPVLLTKDCGVHERLEGVVTWINPLSPKDIAEKMCNLMQEEEYAKAKERARSFAFARDYDDVAQDILTYLK